MWIEHESYTFDELASVDLTGSDFESHNMILGRKY